jgi:hypothetical protein
MPINKAMIAANGKMNTRLDGCTIVFLQFRISHGVRF